MPLSTSNAAADNQSVAERILDILTRPLTLWKLNFSILDLAVQVLLPLVVAAAAYKVVLLLILRFILRPLRIKEATRRRAYRTIRLSLRLITLAAFSIYFVNLLGPNISGFLTNVWTILTTPLVTAGSARITIITIVLTIPIFYLGSWISRLTKRFVDSSVLEMVSMPDEAKFTISILLRNIVLIVAILIGLSLIGIDLSALAVLFGVLGIGIGFGLQSVVASFIAGFVLIFERPVKEGDRIQVDGMEGDVVHIRLRSTIINTLTNETIVVPNNKLIESNIHNYSHMDERIIIVNAVQVAYGTDLIRARDVLQAANDENPYALPDPPPEVRVVAFQDSGILLELRTWIAHAVEKYRAITWVNLEIWRQLKAAGITIPFPQRDVYIKSTPKAQPTVPGDGPQGR